MRIKKFKTPEGNTVDVDVSQIRTVVDDGGGIFTLDLSLNATSLSEYVRSAKVRVSGTWEEIRQKINGN